MKKRVREDNSRKSKEEKMKTSKFVYFCGFCNKKFYSNYHIGARVVGPHEAKCSRRPRGLCQDVQPEKCVDEEGKMDDDDDDIDDEDAFFDCQEGGSGGGCETQPEMGETAACQGGGGDIAVHDCETDDDDWSV